MERTSRERELIKCPFCAASLLANNLPKHCQKVHRMSSFNIVQGDDLISCSECHGRKSKRCQTCEGLGLALVSNEDGKTKCPICQQFIGNGSSVLIHVIQFHARFFVENSYLSNSPFTLKTTAEDYKIGTSANGPVASQAIAREPNAAFKRKLFERRQALKKKKPPVEACDDSVNVARCSVCDIVIAQYLLPKHHLEIHEWRPKPSVSRVPKKNRKVPASIPVIRATSVNTYKAHDLGRRAICPRCGGDGGVRGGCWKCDGTGWVPEQMEKDFTYNSSIGDPGNSKVSNADYQGGNLGGHFRDIDGRIGSIPLHDDYSEESE